eukprot:TRINITY_DN36578_c0_g1_i1.p1 TRINITY_DN36578_c0_g1~~TRINITY_DN36578_c0_g1_i1.p1  ORF type:complete len:281 (+),score=97.47 TRINITY_DN36578_c0_g1_i1:51-845(+)
MAAKRYVVGADWAGHRRNTEVLVRAKPSVEAVRLEAERVFTLDAKCEKAAPWHSSEGLEMTVSAMKIYDPVLESWSSLLHDFQLRERTQIWCTSEQHPFVPDIADIPKTRSGFTQVSLPAPGSPAASGWRLPGSPWRSRYTRSGSRPQVGSMRLSASPPLQSTPALPPREGYGASPRPDSGDSPAARRWAPSGVQHMPRRMRGARSADSHSDVRSTLASPEAPPVLEPQREQTSPTEPRAEEARADAGSPASQEVVWAPPVPGA